VKPRYDQVTLKPEARHNTLQQVLSPDPDDDGVWIHQDAWFYLGKFDQGFTTDYTVKKAGNGVYAFVLSGDLTINGQDLATRDGFGVWDVDKLTIVANSQDAELLLMEVPMKVS
jgi:redox-sensitive bicupin YhaK (pirin superfamily)